MTDRDLFFTKEDLEQSPNIESGKRVNYVKGQILGVNEFRQEQYYFLEKEYFHNRALHGYGVVRGLEVTARQDGAEDSQNGEESGGETSPRPSGRRKEPLVLESDGDVELVIKRGVAIDQFGRVFELDKPELCANLSEWLIGNPRPPEEREDDDNGGTCGTHTRTLYVFGRYSEELTDSRPIAGEPCSTNAKNEAFWRIKDHYELGLSWDAPPMPAWDYAQKFMTLLAHIRVVPDFGRDPETTNTIIDLLSEYVQMGMMDEDTTVADVIDNLPDGEPPYFRLEMSYASYVFSVLYDLYNTYPVAEASPQVADIVLATITLHYDTNDGFVLRCVTVEDDERPVLLNTQSLQAIDIIEDNIGYRTFEFGHMHTLDSNRILLWLHVIFPDLPEELSTEDDDIVLFINGERVTGTITPIDSGGDPSVRPTSKLYLIEGITPSMSGEVQAELRLNLLELWDGVDLAQFESYLGFNPVDGILTLYAMGRIQAVNTRPLATVAAYRNTDGALRLRVGFYTDSELSFPDDALQIQVQNDNRVGTRTTRITGVLNSRELWEVTHKGQRKLDDANVNLIFNLDQITQGGRTLQEIMEAEGFVYEHYAGGNQVIMPFIYTPLLSIADVEAVVQDNLNRLRITPLATIRPLPGNSTASGTFEVWFHVSTQAGSMPQTITGLEDGGLRVYAETDADIVPIDDPSIIQQSANLNIYTVTLTTPVNDDNEPRFRPEYLRFEFMPGAIAVGNYTLQEWIDSGALRFTGYLPDSSSIVIFVRNPVVEE